MASIRIPYLSEDEYLSLEREAKLRSEYHDGQIYAKALIALRMHLARNPLFQPTTDPNEGGIPNGK